MPSDAERTIDVEQVVDVVVLLAPRVADERGGDAAVVEGADRVEHLLVRAHLPREPVREVVSDRRRAPARVGASNVVMSIVPVSSSTSAARAAGSSRNAVRTSAPSRRANASKESSMLVVSTPPQSIRRATTRSAACRLRGRGSCGARRGPGRARGTRRGRASRASRGGPGRRPRRGGRAGAGRRASVVEVVRVALQAGERPDGLAGLARRRLDRVARVRLRVSPAARSSRPLSAARRPNTKHSLSELDASRLAPCRPVQAHSPTA